MKCDICRNEMFQEKRYLYFSPDREGVWIICKSCERILNCVTNPRRKRWVHLAIERLEENLRQIEDVKLAVALQQDIEKRIYQIGMHKPHL